ncbi:hypothetical protein EVJ58_g7154 [Rhodofomes roseus]|uniref:Uncharacterized protein n=1 Tax=Rhodofomes roseus TaxID=34475 RepID=A0A4Y9Y6J9_9APHY|nr:hypothetical protein EVJ58_g7154 [Rhodofomes roseus]
MEINSNFKDCSLNLGAPQGVPPAPQTGVLTALQSLISEALKMSNPVGAHPDDDARLVRALYESESNGQTYRQALDSLSEVNGHSAGQWTDYFLDHGSRIHRLINKLAAEAAVPPAPPRQPTQLASPPATASNTPVARPFLSATRDEGRDIRPASPPPIPRSTQPAAAPLRPSLQSISSRAPDRGRAQGRPPPTSSSGRRDSYSPDCPMKNPRPPRRHASSEDFNLHPNSAEIRVPQRPLHAPTPPTHAVRTPNGLGNTFTDEDKKFFVDFILWEVGKDASLTKTELYARLAQKAPHHDAASWNRYWARNTDLADKVYRTAKASAEKATRRSSGVRRGSLPNPPGPDMSDDEDASAGSDSEESDGELSDWRADPDTDADVANMGGHNEVWSNTDLRVLARWIARQPRNWKCLPRREKYSGFVRKYSNRRTVEACYYTHGKNKKTIDRMVRQYSAYMERKKSQKAPPPKMKVERVEISLLSEDEKEDIIGEAYNKRKAEEHERPISLESLYAEKRRKTSAS